MGTVVRRGLFTAPPVPSSGLEGDPAVCDLGKRRPPRCACSVVAPGKGMNRQCPCLHCVLASLTSRAPATLPTLPR